jgi:hypothetical protein
VPRRSSIATLLTALALTGCAAGTSGPAGDGSSTTDSHPASDADGSADGSADDSKPEIGPPCGPAGCDDSLPCTSDSCVSGHCVFDVKPGFCLIQGACHADGTKQPGAQCGRCNAAGSTSSWTDDPSLCTDDGLSCTTTACSGGACTHALTAGFCLINNQCVADGTPEPGNACRGCVAAYASSAYVDLSDGTACSADALSCTDDVCKAGACSHPTKSGHCLIAGACHANGAADPANTCQRCASPTSTSAWSPQPAGTACAGGVCVGAACCTGCLSSGACLPGTSTSACGAAGNACVACPVGLTCSGGSCQSAPTLTLNVGSHNSVFSNAALSRGFFFTAPQNFTIVGLRVPTSAGTGPQNVEVLRLNVTPPAYSSSTTSFSSLYYAKGVAGTAFIKVNIPFTTGQIVGILGTRGTTTMNSSYAASPTYNTTLNGKPITLTRLLLQKSLYSQKADAVSTSANPYGRIEVQYVPN